MACFLKKQANFFFYECGGLNAQSTRACCWSSSMISDLPLSTL